VRGLPRKGPKTRNVMGFRVLFIHWAFALCFVVGAADPVKAAVEEAKVMEVAEEMACLCGDCPNRPLDECRCGFAGQQRERIAQGLESGMTKDQVIAGFVGEFGLRIFVTPPAEGFNLMAWFMPIFGILIGGFAVRAVLRGWSRDAVQPATQAGSTLSDADRENLDSVLRERDV
jgi:cytochrome c-type biogenesis protein CcmH/NrfF